MAVRPVLRLGDPRLRQVAEPVEGFATAELFALSEDLRDTMRACDGAGLAAPQIGIPLRVVLFGISHNPRYPEAPPIPETLLINPTITPQGPECTSGWEGCLSVPGLRGLVPRPQRVRYTGFDVRGEPIDRCVEGFHARVVQHECDHLDGVLFPDRIEDHRAFGFTEELERAGLLPAVRPNRAGAAIPPDDRLEARKPFAIGFFHDVTEE